MGNWRPTAREEVESILAQELESLPPAYRAHFERIRVAPRKAAVTSAPDEFVYVIAEHQGKVLYWSDIDEGWELEALDSFGGIAQRGSNQYELRNVMLQLSEKDDSKPAAVGAVRKEIQRPGKDKEVVASAHLTRSDWNRQRPESLVIACSDGRLQENLDDFLHLKLGITHYDRLYAPGGAGALASRGGELLRPGQFQRDCQYLLRSHGIRDLYLIFHGPTGDGPEEAVCGDYRRKLPSATITELRQRQEEDAAELKRVDWGKEVRVHTYRCEVRADNRIQFIVL